MFCLVKNSIRFLNAKVFSALPAFYLLLFSDFHSKSTPPAVSIGAANRVLKRGG